MIEFTLHGDPMGWQRAGIRVIPATRTRPAFPSIYTSKETRAYEAALQMAAKIAMRDKPLITDAVCLVVTAHMAVPSSWSNRKRDKALAGVLRPTVKPDWDNIGKMTDALKGVVWADDTQVVDGRVIKLYTEKPRLHVNVMPLIGDVFFKNAVNS